jgi:hypothetical protein
MPVLENAKYELFAQALAKGRSQDAAYADAGFKPDRGHASRLASNGDVQRRVAALKARIAEKAEWSAADRLSALRRISDVAEEKDPRVAVSAIAEANKMQGTHAPIRKEHTGRDGMPISIIDVSRLKGMSNEQLQLLDQTLVQLGIVDDEEQHEDRR